MILLLDFKKKRQRREMMEVGYMMFLSNLQDNMADDVMIREELRIAELAEGLGYDTIY